MTIQTTEWFDSTYADLSNVIKNLARKVAREYDLDWKDVGDDFIQSGWEGALKARDRYQPQGFKFISYCWYYLNGEIRKAARFAVAHKVDSLDVLQDIEYRHDPTFDVVLQDLLASPDGLELLALELGYKDDSKNGLLIRRGQREMLRKKWNLANAS